jgi:hypothetical protein
LATTNSVLNRAKDGMERAYEAADAAWKFAAEAAVYKTARELNQFTVDDVWERFPEGIERGTALGSVMRASADAGLILSTAHYVRSSRPSNHGRPVTVWLSNIYVGKN